MRQTTEGWDMLVIWRRGNQQWIPLRLLKQSRPVDVAEFAQSYGIESEPAFQWWVPYTLRKKKAIILSINSQERKARNKYGLNSQHH